MPLPPAVKPTLAERLAALKAKAEAGEQTTTALEEVAAASPGPDVPAWVDAPGDVPTDEEAEAALLAGLPVESVETVPPNS